MRSMHCSLSPTLLQPRLPLRRSELFRTHLLSRRRQWREPRHSISAAVQTPCNQWPDPDFVIKTKRVFPQKGIADAEEARVLFSSGYILFDVRAELDCQAAGRIRGSVHIPILHAKSVWSVEEGRKLVVREPSPDWLKKVLRKFPDKHTPLLVSADEANRQAGKDALKLLDRAGYACLVELRGGFDAWNAVFDFKMNRRRVAPVSALTEAAAGQAAAAEAAASQAQPASQALPSQEPAPAEGRSGGPGAQEELRAVGEPSGLPAGEPAGESAGASASPEPKLAAEDEAKQAAEAPREEEDVGAVEALAAQRLTFEEVEAARAKLQRALELSSDDEDVGGSYGQVEGRSGRSRLGRRRPASPPPTRSSSRSLRPSSRPPAPPARPSSLPPQPEEPEQPKQQQQQQQQQQEQEQPAADASGGSPAAASALPASPAPSPRPLRPSSRPPARTARPLQPAADSPDSSSSPTVPTAADGATPSSSSPAASASPAAPAAPSSRPPCPSSRMPSRTAAPLAPAPNPGALPEAEFAAQSGPGESAAAGVEAASSSPAATSSPQQAPAGGVEATTASGSLPPQASLRPPRPSSRMPPLATKPPPLSPAHEAGNPSSSTPPAVASATAPPPQSSRPPRPSSRMPPLAAKASAAPAASTEVVHASITTPSSSTGSSSTRVGAGSTTSDASSAIGGSSDGSSSLPELPSLGVPPSATAPSSGSSPLAPAPSDAPQPPMRPPRPSSRMPLRTAKAPSSCSSSSSSQSLTPSESGVLPSEAAGGAPKQAAADLAAQEPPASQPVAAGSPLLEPAAAATAQDASAVLQQQQQQQQPMQAAGSSSGKQGSRWKSLVGESAGALEGQTADSLGTAPATRPLSPSEEEQPQPSSPAHKAPKLPRRLDNIESGFYICPELLDKVAIHLAKNFLALPRIKTPPILGIWGAQGQGKAFQCSLAFRKLGVSPIVLSGPELASGTTGDPSLVLRQRYLEAAEAVRKGRMCALLVSDLEAGGQGQPGEAASIHAVHAALMEFTENPTEVQLPGGKIEAVPRVPIVCTGSDFSTLYAPLIEDGRMEKFYWNPTREDRISTCLGIFQQGGLSRRDAEELVDAFTDQPIEFFSALRSKMYDDQVRQWIAGVGVENLGDQLMGSPDGGARFEKPGVELAALLRYGQALLDE